MEEEEYNINQLLNPQQSKVVRLLATQFHRPISLNWATSAPPPTSTLLTRNRRIEGYQQTTNLLDLVIPVSIKCLFIHFYNTRLQTILNDNCFDISHCTCSQSYLPLLECVMCYTQPVVIIHLIM